MRHIICGSLAMSVSVLVGASAMAAPARSLQNGAAPAAPDGQLKADIQRSLAGLDLPSRLTVDVKDGIVTVSGTVPSVWLKEEANSRVVKVGHYQSFVSDIIIAKAESDQALARDVSESIRHYSRYTVYDNIDGRVLNGTVRLDGAVTDPTKLSELLERVGKIHGVQAIDNKMEVLPVSQSDERLRSAIVNAIYRDAAFANYSQAEPPIHVIVNNGHVTLIGTVRTELERRKAETAARTVFGVLGLEDKVQFTTGPNSAR
jgi:hyperosmotically inducible protein